MSGFSIPMAVREFAMLAPRSGARTDAQVLDSIQHVSARFGTTLTQLDHAPTDTGMRAFAGVLSGTETGVGNALRSLAELELRGFAR